MSADRYKRTYNSAVKLAASVEFGIGRNPNDGVRPYTITYSPGSIALGGVRWGHEIPHVQESQVGWLGIDDEKQILIDLAFTDVAFANLDELIVEIDKLDQSIAFGNNDPGQHMKNGVISHCLDVIRAAGLSDIQQARAIALFGLVTSADKPGRMFYRIRETILNGYTLTVDPVSHAVSVVVPSTANVPNVKKELIGKAAVKHILLHEGTIEEVDGVKVQVVPRNGLTKNLSSMTSVEVTVSSATAAFPSVTTTFSTTEFSADALPTGFGVPATTMPSDFTGTATGDAALEEALTEGGGGHTTISEWSVKQGLAVTQFASCSQTSHQENARALSIAYAALCGMKKKYGKRLETTTALATKISDLEIEAAMPYLYSPVIEDLIGRVASPADAKASSTLSLFKTRSYSADGQVVWSVDVSAKVQDPVPTNSVVMSEMARLNTAVLQLAESDSTTPFVDVNIGGVLTSVAPVIADAFDTDDQTSSNYCAEYSGPYITTAGYNKLRMSALGGTRLLTEDASHKKRAEIFQVTWDKTNLVFYDTADILECLRQDAESEWQAAMLSIKKDALLVTDKKGKCPALLLAAAVAGVAIAASNDDDDKAKKENNVKSPTDGQQPTAVAPAPQTPTQSLTINIKKD